MKKALYQLSDLLNGSASPTDLKPYDRVRCSINEWGCWLVENYSLAANGYPRFRDEITGQVVVIQRRVWETVHNDFIPIDKVVVRTCGNTNCTNPEHLSLRDKEQTVAEMKARRIAEINLKSSLKNQRLKQVDATIDDNVQMCQV